MEHFCQRLGFRGELLRFAFSLLEDRKIVSVPQQPKEIFVARERTAPVFHFSRGPCQFQMREQEVGWKLIL
jgi:hypothetical protein